jgi:hypothetical protein
VPENLLDLPAAPAAAQAGHVGLMSLDLPAGRQVNAMILSWAPHRGQQSGSASSTCWISAACLCVSARRQAQPWRASRAEGGRAGAAVPAAARGCRWARWPRVLLEYHP